MPKGRKPTVVDTNVAVVANRRDGGSYTCASSCAHALMQLRESGTIVLDNLGTILEEYKSYLNYKGQPGPGDAFFRWLFNNRGRTDLCIVISIQPVEHPWRKFVEFPDDNALSAFDPADQKFVAVARGVERGAQILQAVDHKWLAWSEHLLRHGVHVKFLCAGEVLNVSRLKSL